MKSIDLMLKLSRLIGARDPQATVIGSCYDPITRKRHTFDITRVVQAKEGVVVLGLKVRKK